MSRFWTLFLTGIAVVALAAAMLAANLVNDGWEREATNNLIRDRFEVEAILKLDARARLDAIAPIAANSDVRSALRRASARRDPREVDEEISTPLRAKLVELNGRLEELQGDLVFAVDREGWIIASIAPGQIPEGAGLGQFPLVRRALEGNVSDDVWVYNDGVFRMAARPVIEGGQYVGALVHGKRFDDALAERLSSRLDGASVGFFHGTEMFASYMPTGIQSPPTRDDMGAGLEGVLEDERFEGGERTEPQELPTGGLAVYSAVTGSARHANVGYSIGRPVRSLDQPWELIMEHASGEAWAALPWPFLGGGGVLLFLIAMFWFWVERDRPLGKLLRASKELRSSPENRFTITDFGGRYRKIANEVNEAMDGVAQAGGAAVRGKAANLDEILGPTEEAQASGSFFGFAGGEEQPPPDFAPVGGGGAPAPGAPAGAPPPKPGSPAPAGPPPGAAAGAPPPPGGPPPPGAAPARPKPPGPPPKPPAPPGPPGGGLPATSVMKEPGKPAPPAGGPPPRAPGAPAGAAPAAQAEEEQTTVSGPPQTGKRKQLKSTLLGVAPPSYDDEEDEDGATMVARVPQELLDASTTEDEEAAHFREVYEKFVETKKQCGESTAGLTLEKFTQTLRKNRDQIVKRHGAKKVRFTVYTKNGKAALKATPIKE